MVELTAREAFVTELEAAIETGRAIDAQDPIREELLYLTLRDWRESNSAYFAEHPVFQQMLESLEQDYGSAS